MFLKNIFFYFTAVGGDVKFRTYVVGTTGKLLRFV